MKKSRALALGMIVTLLPIAVLAQVNDSTEITPEARVRWQFSPYTLHFTHDDKHKVVLMVGLEREHANAKLDGFTLFTNSFGQPTIYVYPWGRVYRPLNGLEQLSFKWTAGLLYGYKDPYEDKVPFNYSGFSPGIIPAIAYEFKTGWTVQVNFLGTAALMIQLSTPII
jgi:hypothetical protein